MRREANYHGDARLETASDASNEYDPFVPSGWCGDPYAWRDFFDGDVIEAQKIVHDEVPHNTLFLWRQFYQLEMIEGQSVQEYLSNF